MGSLESRMDSFEIKMGSFESRIDSIEVKLDSLESKTDSIEAKLGSLETKTDSIEVKLGLLESKTDSIEAKLDTHMLESRQEHREIRQLINISIQNHTNLAKRTLIVEQELGIIPADN